MSSRDDEHSDSAVDSPVLAHESSWDPTQVNQPGRRLIITVAELEDCDPATLPPLFESVDPEALNALFSNADAAAAVDRVRLSYCGYTIEITPSELTVMESE